MTAEARDAVRTAIEGAWREFGAELDMGDPLGRQLLANQLVHRGIGAGGGCFPSIEGPADDGPDLVEARLVMLEENQRLLWKELRALRSETHG